MISDRKWNRAGEIAWKISAQPYNKTLNLTKGMITQRSVILLWRDVPDTSIPNSADVEYTETYFNSKIWD